MKIQSQKELEIALLEVKFAKQKAPLLDRARELVGDLNPTRVNDAYVKLRVDELRNLKKEKRAKSRFTRSFTGEIVERTFEPQEVEFAKDESRKFLGGIYHPWRRLFARTVDLLTTGLLAYMLVVVYAVYLVPEIASDLGGTLTTFGPLFDVIALYLVWIPIEALFLAVLGTTPAKWVFGIRVFDRNDTKLSYRQALSRTFLVWFKGEGFAIPIVNLFTRYFAYRRLTKTGTTLWDTEAETIVIHTRWGIVRTLASILSVILALVILVIFSAARNSV